MGNLAVVASVSLVVVLSIAPLPLAGCVIEAGEAAPPTEVAVAGPPPQPVREVRSPPPKNVRAIWVAGYWHWTGMQYTWIPGHWESARAGAEWRAPHYTVREGVYFYEPGGWSTRR